MSFLTHTGDEGRFSYDKWLLGMSMTADVCGGKKIGVDSSFGFQGDELKEIKVGPKAGVCDMLKVLNSKFGKTNSTCALSSPCPDPKWGGVDAPKITLKWPVSFLLHSGSEEPTSSPSSMPSSQPSTTPSGLPSAFRKSLVC